jgi:hypothetical protein
MRRLQMQLFLTTSALIVSWLMFFGFGVYTWVRLNDIEKYSVTYDCELAEKLDSTPIEVKAKCAKLRKK